MLCSDSGFTSFPQGHSSSWPLQNHVEVHSENTRERVILQSQVNMLLNSESEASSVGEIPFSQFSVLNL